MFSACTRIGEGEIGAEIALHVVLRNAGVLNGGHERFGLHLRVCAALTISDESSASFGLTPYFAASSVLRRSAIKTLDRRIARRRLVQHAKQFHALVDIDVR